MVFEEAFSEELCRNYYERNTLYFNEGDIVR
jgi:hypothetical protein